MQGYCVKCRRKVEISNPKVKRTKRGVRIACGICPHCGTKVCRILGK